MLHRQAVAWLLQRSPDLAVGDRGEEEEMSWSIYLLQRSPDLAVGDRGEVQEAKGAFT